jgi:hypothetical protein
MDIPELGRMDIPELLVIHAAPHPDDRVRRVGFTLDQPYLEHCWTPVLGPTSVLLLRRATWLWRSGTSTAIRSEDLAVGLGLGRGTGRNSALNRTVQRLVTAGFAAHPATGELEVYTEVPLLGRRQLERVPGWTRSVHEQLVARRVRELDAARQSTASAAPSPLSRPLPRPRTTERSGLGLA